jgi:flavin reductase (DIM6/NTAB) family NADH-FMN oxidoreductase RutF
MTSGDPLHDWPPGTVAILSTAGAAPHAVPISTAVRAGPRRVLLALARTRASLARLRDDPRCALTVLAAGDVAFTAHGRATVVQEPMDVAESVAAVAIDVDDVQSHADPRFAIDAGVAWRWVDDEAAARDAAIHEALRRLAG